jgi:hypothetical protein
MFKIPLKPLLLNKKPKDHITLKGNVQLIVHFGYHKAMTVFFIRIFQTIAKKYHFYHKHHNADLKGFYKDVHNKKGLRIVSVNNQLVNFSFFPKYKGTHLVRDPRDLLVSGYRYHQHCNEPWSLQIFDKESIELFGIKELGLEKKAQGLNFQELLKNIDKEAGYLLELNLRKPHFKAMWNWDYSNPNILELRYEDIFGNEIDVFQNIFAHYGFPKNYIDTCLQLVRQFSFKALTESGQVGSSKHAAVGKAGQWKNELPEMIIRVFHDRYNNLITKLNY